tara:strand:+ start:324 stop:734 length:411 start_codon:yes stop_codon:yes gene_type:complete
MERLFVDVDETLVFHDGCCGSPELISSLDEEIWDFDFSHPLMKNYPLAEAVIKWQRTSPDRKVFVWSLNNSDWVNKAANIFFKGIIPLEGIGSKYDLHGEILSTDLAIDDREQDMRWYLEPFEQVFSPEEFVQLME